jgi:hypothetical protein
MDGDLDGVRGCFRQLGFAYVEVRREEKAAKEAKAHADRAAHAQQRGSARRSGTKWARLDSNQGPTDYESAALTS